MPADLAAGFTVADLARRYRVGEDKVRLWIKRGELIALNTSMTECARPRFVVTADALEQFEQRRRVGPAHKKPKRQRKSDLIDYYPD